MSLCHIWFGVARSKKRGFGSFRVRLFAVGGLISFASCRTVRTFSGDAFKKKNLFKMSDIRRIPCVGSVSFNSTIFASTALMVLAFEAESSSPGARIPPATPRPEGFDPSPPDS